MSFSRVGVVYNPISGRGLGESVASDLRAKLIESGVEVPLYETARDYLTKRHLASLVDSLIVCGGDGTIMMLLEKLILEQLPVYMLPLGNESLFSREFSMSSNTQLIASSFKQATVKSCYVPQANGRYFFSMLSVGLDADVIAQIAKTRLKAIGHRGYLMPVLRELLRHKPPRLSLTVDGKQVLSEQSGYLIVANSAQYALRLSFVPEARVFDDELAVRFFPYDSLPKLFITLSDVARKRASKVPLFKAKDVLLESTSGLATYAQADGESLGELPMRIRAKGAKLQVVILGKQSVA